MFLQESSRRSSTKAREQTLFEKLLECVSEVRLISAGASVHEHETAYALANSTLKLVCHKETETTTVLALKEAFQDMLSSSMQLAQTSKELQSRDDTLSLISSAMINYSEADLSVSQLIEPLMPSAKYALLKNGETLFNKGFTELALGSCIKHSEASGQGSVRVLDGELYFCQSEPFHLFIESSEPIPQPIKALVNLYLSQLGDKERQFLQIDAERRSRKLERLANEDPLTGLANRRGLNRYIKNLLEDPNANSAQHAMLHIDLDYFKAINDTLGHATGDALLVKVSDILKSSIRRYDLAARIGGDEFCVLTPFISGEKGISHLAQNIINQVSAINSVEGKPCKIGASIGIALSPYSGPINIAHWTENADLALYSSKQHGREQFCWFNDTLRSSNAS